MDPTRDIKIHWLGGFTYQIASLRTPYFPPQKWQPPINSFRCEAAVRICVDLAGVDRSHIDLTVEPRRVVIRGTRIPPEPRQHEGRTVQLLALEIDFGPFEREVILPADVEVDVEQAHAEQENGLLWITLPLKK